MNNETLPFLPETFERRLAAARDSVAKRGLDAMLVTLPANIYYLSGFHTPAYDYCQFVLVPANGAPTMFNILHESQYLVAQRSYIQKRFTYPGFNQHLEAAGDLLVQEGLAAGRIGVDKASFFLTVRDMEGLAKRLPKARFEDTSGLVESLRKVKTAEEIAYIRQAARVAEAGMRAGVEACREGATGLDIAAAVHHALILAGGDYMSYPPFINVGWASSLVHNTWDATKAVRGDLVFLELSGVVRRYGAALMRSVAIGPIAEEMEKRNKIVHDVLQRTIDAIRPGVTSGQANQACLDAFARHGYKNLKRAGYSMGINFPPGWSEGNFLDISTGNPTVLEAGMVFHLPQPFRVAGQQTVSTSETVLVAADGCEPITDFPRELFRK